MAKYNTGTLREAPRSTRGSVPMRAATKTPNAHTHEGGVAFAFDLQSELFFALSGSFITEDSAYEKGNDKVARVRDLIFKITEKDASEDRAASGRWFADFTKWLRTEAFIRTGAVVLSAEVVAARQKFSAPGFSRETVNAACDRGDEPGELIGYWLAHYGKTIPVALKRGLADAVVRLYSEYSTLRYDTNSKAIRFGDVVELVQPRTNARASAGAVNHELFRHLIDRRHDYNTNPIPESLSTLRAREALEKLPVAERRAVLSQPERLKAAAMSWEALAGWLQGPMDKAAWEAIAPTMGYMALLRNLRNFDENGVDDVVAAKIAAQLSDPAQVAKSRQLPFRFWTAYREVANARWKVALGTALELATANIPAELGGRTLVLVDTSGSMSHRVSERSSVSMHEVAGLFGVAMAYRFGVENVDLYGFADYAYEHKLRKGASVLQQVDAFFKTNGKAGWGTQIELSVKQSYNKHDRVVLFSDMQTWGSHYAGRAGDLVPRTVPFYAFNLDGSSTTVINSESNRFQIGGLSDKTFGLMVNVERGLESGWPWQVSEG